MLSFKDYLTEQKSIFDYLLFEPKGRELELATAISKMASNPKYVYRGMSIPEYKILKAKRIITSKGEGNTRGGKEPYVSDNIQLAGRFAIRAWKDYPEGGVLVTLNKSKLPTLVPADRGNYRTEYIPLSAVEDVYVLK
jgi:hypothetical protein